VRFAACAVALLLLDAALTAYLRPGDVRYDKSWRMPRTLPTSELPRAVEAIEHQTTRSSRPVVVFVGASPAWGDAVATGSQSVPARFSEASAKASLPVDVYNLASNGQLLGDAYFIARRMSGDADVLYVQLTYHNFNPAMRDGTTRRYPELASMLGVRVSRRLASILGADATPRADVTGAVDRWLRAHWVLYETHDQLAAKLLGSTPETRLRAEWESLLAPEGWEGELQREPSGLSFDELPPEEQTLVLDEFAATGEFDLRASDPELRTLTLLAEELKASGTRTVFYISPLNATALTDNGLFDRARYRRNVARIRAAAEASGHTFVDMNSATPLPSSAFADLNHTTGDGSVAAAAMLLDLSRAQLEAAR